jgi:hypothetical protein
VRSCLEVTCFFRNDIAHLIQRHIITTAAGPVSIPPKDKVSEVEDDMSFSIETARYVIPFLEAFPNLVFCHIGGYSPMYTDTQKILFDGIQIDLSYCH